MDINRVFDLLPHYRAAFGDDKQMLADKKQGQWKPLSITDFQEMVDQCSRALVQEGIEKGDFVAIVMENCSEWNIIDFAIQQIGAVSVPVYPTITLEDYEYVFNHSQVKLAFTGDKELYNKVSTTKERCVSLGKIVSLVPGTGGQLFQDFLAQAQPEVDIDAHKEKVDGEDLLTIIYTSGTTGRPKGVMLTHNNLISNFKACVTALPIDHRDTALSFLPMCHIFERMVVFFYFYRGLRVYYAENMQTIGEDLKDVKPQFFTTAPRMLEKVYDKIVTKGYELSGIKRVLFFWALALGKKYDYATSHGPLYSLQLWLARKLIFSKWQAALGGNIRFIVSGSAALSPELAKVFAGAGILVLEGYGLTETSPVVSVNRPEKSGSKLGTVGPLIDGVEARIAQDGEIWIKGPNVMKGYYKNQEATEETITEDGWLKTGDIGEMVEDKFLKITDRKKSMFKTSGGKYIAPQVLENKLKSSMLIEQVMIIGEGQRFPAALIVPNFEALKEYCDYKEIPYTNPVDMICEAVIQDKFQREVDKINLKLGNWERIKRFRLLSSPFEIEKGELTATLKLKRNVIEEHYLQDIAYLYEH